MITYSTFDNGTPNVLMTVKSNCKVDSFKAENKIDGIFVTIATPLYQVLLV